MDAAPAAFAPPPAAAAEQESSAAFAPRLRARAAGFWLAAFFWAAEHAPRLTAAAGRPLGRAIFLCSRATRRGTTANARRILGPGASQADVTALARRTLSSFYLFCCDIGRSFGLSREQLIAQIDSDSGRDRYDAARAAGKGVIVVTAHMGSFEVGMAALRQVERKGIHVVFRRDPIARFDRQRSELRARLGVVEAPVDEGLRIWVRLRDALLNDDAVVLQGDRVMPGQKGEAVPFLGGTLMLPPGPIKLALATGAPIVPTFSVRMPGGKVKLFIEPAIEVGNKRAKDGAPHPALLEWARVLERYVKTYPDQWLLLQPALVEDKVPTPSPGTPGEGGGEGSGI